MITNNDTINDVAVGGAIRHAIDSLPCESCGAVIDGDYFPFDNVAGDKENSFRIESAYLERSIIDGSCECIIHSHNDKPYASFEDMVQQFEVDVPYGIVSLLGGKPHGFMVWGRQVDPAPYIGRDFFFGVQDCWNLVRDYTFQEKGIELINPPREYGFLEKKESVFESYTDKAGLVEIDKKDAAVGDIMFYKYGDSDFITHAGIFIGDQVLHHFKGKLSGVYPVGFCIDYLVGVYRVK